MSSLKEWGLIQYALQKCKYKPKNHHQKATEAISASQRFPKISLDGHWFFFIFEALAPHFAEHSPPLTGYHTA